MTLTPAQLRASKAHRQRQKDKLAAMREALKPFADCADQIDPEEDDEEWAKFRLLVSDYRRARQALGDQK